MIPINQPVEWNVNRALNVAQFRLFTWELQQIYFTGTIITGWGTATQKGMELPKKVVTGAAPALLFMEKIQKPADGCGEFFLVLISHPFIPLPCKSKDHWNNGFSPKTILLVGNLNHPKLGTIILKVFDFRGLFTGFCTSQVDVHQIDRWI